MFNDDVLNVGGFIMTMIYTSIALSLLIPMFLTLTREIARTTGLKGLRKNLIERARRAMM